MLIDAGFFLRTHDFLQPLEKPGASPEDETSSLPQQPPPQPVVKQHALPLPGGVGTFSIRPAPVVKAEQHALPLPGGVGTFSIRPAPVVKAEPPLVLWGQPTTQPGGRGAFFFLPACTRTCATTDSPTARRTCSVRTPLVTHVVRLAHGCRVPVFPST
jgi:hypothetical protein